MNILFTCVGSRNYLIEYFRAALGTSGAVYATDTSALAPGLAAADKQFIVPPVSADNYIDKLLALVNNEDINAIISLNDLELPVLAAAADQFAEKGTKVIVSDPQVIDTCFDKWKTAEFFKKIGVNTPQTFILLGLPLMPYDQARTARTTQQDTLRRPAFVLVIAIAHFVYQLCRPREFFLLRTIYPMEQKILSSARIDGIRRLQQWQ